MRRGWWLANLWWLVAVAYGCGSDAPTESVEAGGASIADASAGASGGAGSEVGASGGHSGAVDSAISEGGATADSNQESPSDGSAGEGDVSADVAPDVGDASSDRDGGESTSVMDGGSDACGIKDVPTEASTDPCLGLTPACSSSCADTDGDGLNDAWEIAGGIDRNGDGRIDACHDLLLPGADRNKLDVYVYYDWMDYATVGNACAVDADCSKLGSGHAGETCTGPQVLPSPTKSCVHPCTTDTDCTSRGLTAGSHVGDKCIAGACNHTHDPEVEAPHALDAVVDSFAAHQINLHILRGYALPHSLVVSFHPNTGTVLNNINEACEGAPPGWIGPGKYAESFYDLKKMHFPDDLGLAYHYAIFGHYNSCDTANHCDACPSSLNPDGSPKAAPTRGASGIAEISGNDFIVSLGNRLEDLAFPPGIFSVASTFMHELGHNLGLHHPGGSNVPCKTNDDCKFKNCSDSAVGKYCFDVETPERNWKPNYLSVMNYRYQFSGIAPSASVGGSSRISCQSDANCPPLNHCNSNICARLDYSNQVLPVGGNTPGKLDPMNVPDQFGPRLGLNEPAGLGSQTADTFTFTDSLCDIPNTVAASDGPVDWNGDGDATDTSVSADVTSGVDHACDPNAVGYFPVLAGNQDWSTSGPIRFTFKFQCTPYGGPNGDGASSSVGLVNEIGTKEVLDAHAMYPVRSAKIVIRPGCQSPLVAAGRSGTIEVALLGSADFDIRDVDATSLRFHHAQPIGSRVVDIDHDGRLDLVLLFDTSRIKLHPRATRGLLRGWLKSSQVFVGDDKVTVVADADRATCR
jgi:hypothetical protein